MFILVDELWTHRKAELWRALCTGASKAPRSLLIVATTAGRGNESPDYPIFEYGKKVQSGEIVDPSFLPIIFEADRDDAWDDEATLAKALPGCNMAIRILRRCGNWHGKPRNARPIEPHSNKSIWADAKTTHLARSLT